MSINATRSEGNTDRMYGYLDGHTDGLKCGMANMKTKACREFLKIISELCPEMVQTDEDIKAMENVFRKRLED